MTGGRRPPIASAIPTYSDLDEALEQRQFRLVYQPVVDLGTRRVVGFEALLRWDHPVLGPVPPSSFVPIAESAGRMVELGRRVLREACTTAARWQRAILRPVP